MLHRLQERPYDRPPFSLAIFIGASLPYSKTVGRGVDMSRLYASTGSTPAVWQSVVPSDDGRLSSDSISSLTEEVISKPLEQIRRWHPAADSTRIQVPTVHVYGEQDPYLPQGLLLKELCAGGSTFAYKHAGGHELPRALRVSKDIAEVILKARARADLSH